MACEWLAEGSLRARAAGALQLEKVYGAPGGWERQMPARAKSCGRKPGSSFAFPSIGKWVAPMSHDPNVSNVSPRFRRLKPWSRGVTGALRRNPNIKNQVRGEFTEGNALLRYRSVYLPLAGVI
jgi:hypothetical protein